VDTQEIRQLPKPVLSHSAMGAPARALLAFPCPPRGDAGAFCVGLTIDWRHADRLRAAALAATLPDEHARAASFLRPQDGLRHLLGRALYRRIAAGCAGADPRGPLVATQPGGKPQFARAGFDGSISHAGDQVWVAIAHAARVGIDVDALAALPDASEVVASLHPREAADIAASTHPETAALRCWVRKEAVAKATGLGLSLPLADFIVDVGEAGSDWLRQAPEGGQVADWHTLDLPAAPGHCAALALHGRCREVRVLHLQLAPEAAG
jgi:4'-phosphopantetheinyl transferase